MDILLMLLLMLPGFILSLILTVIYEHKLRKPQNKVHFYIARDMDGRLYIYLGKPHRGDTEFYGNADENSFVLTKKFKRFGLNANDYANLKWKDEPLEVFLNLGD